MRITIAKKMLAIMLVLTIVPLGVLAYFAVTQAGDMGYDAADSSGEALQEEAETSMQRLATDSAANANDFFAEAESDLRGVAKNMNTVHNTPDLWNTEHTGDSFAFWATSAWPDHTDGRTLAQWQSDAAYSDLVTLLDDTEKAALDTALATLNDPNSYDVLQEADYSGEQRHVPRFLISPSGSESKSEFFFGLQSDFGETVEASDDPFALVDFMFGLLDATARSDLRKGMNMLSYGISTVDSHDAYENLRMGYWGHNTDKEGIEFVYPGTSAAYNPATNGVGNSYYCKSPFSLRDSGTADTVWKTKFLDETIKVSMATYPVYETFDDPSTDLIGFVEYWISWATLSDEVVNVSVADTGYMLMIDGTGQIVSHPVAERLGTDFAEEGNSSLDEIVAEMTAGESGLTTLTYEGEEVYLTYAPIEETGWSVALLAPVDEIVAPATQIRANIDQEVDSLRTTLIIVAAIVVVVAAIAAVIFARRMTQPIKKLTTAADKISKGDVSATIDVKSKDEIGDLAESFERMVRSVRFLMQDKEQE